MYAWDLIEQFLRDMRARKLRTALALFGIAWGTVSVVLLLAISDAFRATSSKAMHGMGEGLVIVWTSRTTKPFAGMQAGRAVEMKASDVIAMAAAVPEIDRASPELTAWGLTLANGSHRVKAAVSGVHPDYEIMRNMVPEPGGRFINDRDVAERRRCIFIGNSLREKLFGTAGGIGSTVLVDGRPFVVIGTLKAKVQSSNYSGPDADRAQIPYTTFISTWGDRDVSNVLLTPTLKGDAEPMKKAVYQYLGRRFRFDPTDEGTLSIWDTVEMDRFTTWFFWGMKALFGMGGLLTLGAGGIGVANVMFLIVRERTREIGVRIAVGARDGHIMAQVMLEAGVIVALGGLLGLSFSGLVILGVHLLPMPEWLGQPELSPSVGLATFGVLALVGLAAGIFPARRAARLDPVRALEG